MDHSFQANEVFEELSMQQDQNSFNFDVPSSLELDSHNISTGLDYDNFETNMGSQVTEGLQGLPMQHHQDLYTDDFNSGVPSPLNFNSHSLSMEPYFDNFEAEMSFQATEEFDGLPIQQHESFDTSNVNTGLSSLLDVRTYDPVAALDLSIQAPEQFDGLPVKQQQYSNSNILHPDLPSFLGSDNYDPLGQSHSENLEARMGCHGFPEEPFQLSEFSLASCYANVSPNFPSTTTELHNLPNVRAPLSLHLANTLNSLPQGRGKYHIHHEAVQQMLSCNFSYDQLCDCLHSYGFRFNRTEFSESIKSFFCDLQTETVYPNQDISPAQPDISSRQIRVYSHPQYSPPRAFFSPRSTQGQKRAASEEYRTPSPKRHTGSQVMQRVQSCSNGSDKATKYAVEYKATRRIRLRDIEAQLPEDQRGTSNYYLLEMEQWMSKNRLPFESALERLLPELLQSRSLTTPAPSTTTILSPEPSSKAATGLSRQSSITTLVSSVYSANSGGSSPNATINEGTNSLSSLNTSLNPPTPESVLSPEEQDVSLHAAKENGKSKEIQLHEVQQGFTVQLLAESRSPIEECRSINTKGQHDKSTCDLLPTHPSLPNVRADQSRCFIRSPTPGSLIIPSRDMYWGPNHVAVPAGSPYATGITLESLCSTEILNASLSRETAA